jgi:hypothetical protein
MYEWMYVYESFWPHHVNTRIESALQFNSDINWSTTLSFRHNFEYRSTRPTVFYSSDTNHAYTCSRHIHIWDLILMCFWPHKVTLAVTSPYTLTWHVNVHACVHGHIHANICMYIYMIANSCTLTWHVNAYACVHGHIHADTYICTWLQVLARLHGT